MVLPSCQSSQQKVAVHAERSQRQRCYCCRAEKWTWRRNSELSLPSWQCHTQYSGLTAALLTVLSNWPKSLYGLQRRSVCVFVCVCECVWGAEESRCREREMSIAAHFTFGQSRWMETVREEGVFFSLLSPNPRYSFRIKAVIFFSVVLGEFSAPPRMW